MIAPGQTNVRIPRDAKQPLQVAMATLRLDRPRGLALLDGLFRAGTPPSPVPDGRYRGSLVALDIAPALTPLVEFVAAKWMPWQGKTFDAEHAAGDNIFTCDSLTLAYLYWPRYRGYVDDGPRTYRAFAFRTSIDAGLLDPDRRVLKIDYNLPANPGLTIRHVVDEIVEVDDGFYLGKAHLRWWWGKWQTVVFFTLER